MYFATRIFPPPRAVALAPLMRPMEHAVLLRRVVYLKNVTLTGVLLKRVEDVEEDEERRRMA